MNVITTGFEGLFVIEPSVYEDERGYFFEAWNRETFRSKGLDIKFLQDNQSQSAKNVLRGLHFQIPPYEQLKLVRVISGSVLDVVVDLRKEQPTFGKHYKCVLTAKSKNMLWIPSGFAHGFLTLEENTVLFYKCSQVYNKSCDKVILWNDPDLAIDWRIENPVVSDKDRTAPRLKDSDNPF